MDKLIEHGLVGLDCENIRRKGRPVTKYVMTYQMKFYAKCESEKLPLHDRLIKNVFFPSISDSPYVSSAQTRIVMGIFLERADSLGYVFDLSINELQSLTGLTEQRLRSQIDSLIEMRFMEKLSHGSQIVSGWGAIFSLYKIDWHFVGFGKIVEPQLTAISRHCASFRTQNNSFISILSNCLDRELKSDFQSETNEIRSNLLRVKNTLANPRIVKILNAHASAYISKLLTNFYNPGKFLDLALLEADRTYICKQFMPQISETYLSDESELPTSLNIVVNLIYLSLYRLFNMYQHELVIGESAGREAQLIYVNSDGKARILNLLADPIPGTPYY